MQLSPEILIRSIRKASKLLQRDFCELEMLQTSNRSTVEFCNKSYQRTKVLLSEELKKVSETVLFSDEKVSVNKNVQQLILINHIDSLINLSKSIPFFGITVNYLQKLNDKLKPFISVIYFPILGDVYYANKGGGAWLEKTFTNTGSIRLRSSSQGILENSTIAIDDYTENISTLTKNIRNFGSNSYNIALFASGKVDVIYFNNILDLCNKFALELFVKESGGFILPFPNDTKLLVSNANLASKLKTNINNFV